VIDHVLIAECDPKHTLPDQPPDLMLDQLRCPAIRETLGKPLDQPDRPIRRPQQQGTCIRGDLAAIKPSYINWLTFTDNVKSVTEDVVRIRNHRLVPNDIPIYGYIYDVKSGKLVEVPEATTAGKAR
jgi:hypothetical protein